MIGGGLNMEKDNTVKKKSITGSTVLYFASFSVYYLLIFIGINGFGFGMQGAFFYYGLAAIFTFLIFLWPFTAFLVLCIIYQIRFANRYFKDHIKLKKAALTVIVFTAVCFLSVIPISIFRNRTVMAEDPGLIREYLVKKYGEEFASGIRLEADSSRSSSSQRFYKVYTDVLPADKYFTVNNDMPGISVYEDDLLETFKSENPFFVGDLDRYLCGKYGIPQDMRLELVINSVDFKDYHNGDDLKVLFERTDCHIKKILMKVDEYSDEQINGCISRVWNDVYPKIEEKVDRLLIIELEHDYRAVWVEIYRKDGGKYVAEISDNSGFEDTAKYNGMIIELKR